jgi:hypothetical protein
MVIISVGRRRRSRVPLGKLVYVCSESWYYEYCSGPENDSMILQRFDGAWVGERVRCGDVLARGLLAL